MALTGFKLSDAHTDTASPPTGWFYVQVRSTERVSMYAIDSPRVNSRDCITSQHVLSIRDGFNMAREYASSMGAIVSTITGHGVAEMIGLQAIGVGPDEVFIGDAVGTYRSSVNPEGPVAIVKEAPSPFPATIIKNANPSPETQWQPSIAENWGGKLSLHRESSFLGAMQPVVTSDAAASIVSR